jgi:AhpD family alkylhydroperoxidase
MSEQQRLRYTELAPEGVAAMRSVEHYCNALSRLEPVLLELVRLRVSLMNGCEYCIGLHSHELKKHNEPETRIAGVATWRDADAYTQRERSAFAWAEVVTNIQQGHVPDEAFKAALEHFSDTEVVNLTIAIASINAFNRMAISFRAQHIGKKPEEQSAVGDDGGKVVEE